MFDKSLQQSLIRFLHKHLQSCLELSNSAYRELSEARTKEKFSGWKEEAVL